MQISNIISSLTDLPTWGKKSEATTSAGNAAANSIESQLQSKQSISKASAEILHNYDITQITPDKFSEMIQKLYQAGALSEKDYQELAAVRTDLENEGIESDESINLLEFYSDKVSKAQKELGDTLDEAGSQQSLGPDMRRLDWLQKFAMIQANPDAAGLDLAA
jgi:hypothetical protein